MIRRIVLLILRDGVSFLSIKLFPFPFLSSFFFSVSLVVLYLSLFFLSPLKIKFGKMGWGVLQDSKMAAPLGTANIDASDAVGT